MKTLDTYLESLLDSDFDMEPTLGDIYDIKFYFGSVSPADAGLYNWKFDKFWGDYEEVRNAWTEATADKPKSRVRFFKRDVRHGLAMYVCTRPVDRITQGMVNGWVREINRLCDGTKLQLDVSLQSTGDRYTFQIWNMKSYKLCGEFRLVRRGIREGLLDSDFDIGENNLKLIDVVPECRAAAFWVTEDLNDIISSAIKLPKLPKSRLSWNHVNKTTAALNVWLCEQPASWVETEDTKALENKFRELLTPAGKKCKWMFNIDPYAPGHYGVIEICIKYKRKWHSVARVHLYLD